MLCLDCVRLALPGKSRCKEHERAADRRRTSRRRHYDGDWDRTSRKIRTEWLAARGPWCPGFGRDGHWVEPAQLTVDHVEAGSRAGGLSVLCRSCNSRKGAR